MTVLSSTVVKSARKPWRCDGCERKFAEGTSYNSQSVKDGDFYTTKWCQTCQGVTAVLCREGLDDIHPDHIYEYVEEFYGSWEAVDAAFGTTGVTK